MYYMAWNIKKEAAHRVRERELEEEERRGQTSDDQSNTMHIFLPFLHRPCITILLLDWDDAKREKGFPCVTLDGVISETDAVGE